jgi:hypothetical protein
LESKFYRKWLKSRLPRSSGKGERGNLYSATQQQAERYVKKIKRNGGKQIARNHPLVIRRDLVKVEKQDTKISKF